MTSPLLSVVVATFQRPAKIERLLRQLAAQTLPPDRFEVVVVDDGSQPPVAPRLRALQLPFGLTVLEQANAGAAAARDRGARAARGDVLVMTDDDMEVPPGFLAAHADVHAVHPRAAVVGRIRADPSVGGWPVFERFHAYALDREAAARREGAPVRGNHLYTGNVSFRRQDYLDVGGFDRTLERAEDVELGLRLEDAGVRFLFSDEAYVVHNSDHDQLQKWLGRAFRYGVYDQRIARKHPHLLHADPWRKVFSHAWQKRPLMVAAVVAPSVGGALAGATIRGALLADRLGFERAAVGLTSLTFDLQYFRGLRAELGGLPAAVGSLRDYLQRAEAADEAAAPAAARALGRLLRRAGRG